MTTPAVNDRLTIAAPAEGTATLSWDFRLRRADALTVVRKRLGVSTVLTYGVHFTLPSGIGNETGGTLTLSAPSLAGDVYMIVGLEPHVRQSDFVTSQVFDSAKVNADLDYLTEGQQELRRDADRAWKSAYGIMGRELSALTVGHFWKADDAGNMIDGGSAEDIANAQEYADIATQAALVAISAVPNAYPFTRTAAKALNTNVFQTIYLREAGREGMFKKLSGAEALAASFEIAADTLEGIYFTAVDGGVYKRIWFGGVYVNWWGAKGDAATDDRAAIQAAFDYLDRAGGGKLILPDGTYRIVGIAGADTKLNGIVMPFTGDYETGSRIIVQGEGKATLKAATNNMIVVRCCTTAVEFRNLSINGGNAYWTALTDTWGIFFGAQDRTSSTANLSTSFARVYDCNIDFCAEGIYYECGPSTPAGSGAFYNIIMNTNFNGNIRAIYWGIGTYTPDNRPTRTLIQGCRITRGALGIDCEFVTEFEFITNFFELLELGGGAGRPIGPRGFRSAYYFGQYCSNNKIRGGYAEDCDNALYVHASALPSAVVTEGFIPHELGVNTGANFIGMYGTSRIRLVRGTSANQQLRLELGHSNFASLIADTAANGTRNLDIRTNDVSRLLFGDTGLRTFGGSSGNITIPSTGTSLAFSLASGANTILCQGAGGYLNILPGAGAGMTINSAGVSPTVDNVSDFGNASYRWKQLFAATATIGTSDAREKDWRGGLTNAEMRVAKRLSKLIGIFRWTEAVAQKGDDARLHIGVTVQDVMAEFAAEGLDPFAYAMVCYDEWLDEFEPVTEQRIFVDTDANGNPIDSDGKPIDLDPPRLIDGDGKAICDRDGVPLREDRNNFPRVIEGEIETGDMRQTQTAGNRYGLRSDHLWAFIAAGFEARLAALEA